MFPILGNLLVLLIALPAPVVPVTVARYTFDAGLGTNGRVADLSGRGTGLAVRGVGGGRVVFNGTTAHRYAAFPAVCPAAAAATACPRALLEGSDDADLDPGTRRFRWGASVRLTKAQVAGSSNVVQKGVAGTGSQWKMQIGATHGKASCVVAGLGDAKTYLARSAVGVADNAWHQVLCQRSGALLTVYVDGHDQGHVAVPATLSVSNGLPLRIGGPNLNASSDMYPGLLDDVYARLG